MPSLYEQDYALWLENTIALLQAQKFKNLDLANLIEELEGIGKSQKQELKSELRVVLLHLLKYRLQSERRSNRWHYTLIEHRTRLAELLADSPSWVGYLDEVYAECYRIARREAAVTFPETSPLAIARVLDIDYLPEG